MDKLKEKVIDLRNKNMKKAVYFIIEKYEKEKDNDGKETEKSLCCLYMADKCFMVVKDINDILCEKQPDLKGIFKACIQLADKKMSRENKYKKIIEENAPGYYTKFKYS